MFEVLFLFFMYVFIGLYTSPVILLQSDSNSYGESWD